MKVAKIGNQNFGLTGKVKNLCDITEDGLFEVEGFFHPVSVERVTQYGEDELSGQVGGFFNGADGVRRYYMETGKFEEVQNV
nr:MAG TPA: hypothetical protein [Caudoviricetes sp.]